MSEYARSERAARRNARDLERRLKEQAKLDLLSLARLEVESYENKIELLLSLHKEVGESWDWQKIASSLPPMLPVAWQHSENAVHRALFVKLPEHQENTEKKKETAKAADREANALALRVYNQQKGAWEKRVTLARKMVARDGAAFREAISELSPFVELSDLGSNVRFTFSSASLVECVLTASDSSVVPAEAKTLTSTGKLSVKALARSRFHEIYQDYLCGGILRVAREIFALLPVERVLVTAVTGVFDSATGTTAEKPVLSVLASRDVLQNFEWEQLDPSDAIATLVHRGDFKASRKTGAFLPIVPLTSNEVSGEADKPGRFDELLSTVAALREQLRAETAALSQ